MSELVNRKGGRTRSPAKVRTFQPSPAPATPAVEFNNSDAPSDLDLQAQEKVLNVTGIFSFWGNLGTWNKLIYFLITWSLSERYWNRDLNLWDQGLTFLYRFVIVGVMTLFGLHWKNDVVKDKTISEWYLGSFRQNTPFLANLFEGCAVMATSQLTVQVLKQCWVNKTPLSDFQLNWDDVKIAVIVTALYITPILTVFYKWANDNWTLGGKWGNALFTQLIFSPIYTIFLLIFYDWTSKLFIGGDLWNGNIWTEFLAKLIDLNNWPKDSYLSKQAINFVFWFPQTVIANFFVPVDYTILFGTVCCFAWNIIFEFFIRV